MGADAFRGGIVSYLKRFSFANAAGEDFWNEVTTVTGKPIDRILRSLVDLEGAPLLVVQSRCVAGKTTEVDVTMERFVGVPGAQRERQSWAIPACLKVAGQQRCEVIERPKQMIRLTGCGHSPSTATTVPLIANAQGRGYYFTEYAPQAARTLAASATRLTPIERLSLLGDEWWMVRAGRHDVDAYLEVASRFGEDRSSAVIEAIAGRLTTVGKDLVTTTSERSYQAWIRQRFAPQLATLGLPGQAGDDDETQTRRATLLELVGAAGNDPDVQKRSRELVTKYLNDPQSLPGTIAPSALRVAALAGDASLYDQYIARLGADAAQPEHYYRVLYALPWFRNPVFIRRSLEYAMSPAVRTQDTGTVLGLMLTHRWSQDTTWEFVRNNWATILTRLGEFQGIPAIIESLGAFCSRPRARDVGEFFAKNPVASSQRGVRQSVERIESCVALKERQQQPLANWLAKR